jgi:hypothetical protein
MPFGVMCFTPSTNTSIDREEEERKMHAEQHNGYGGGGSRFRSRFFDFFRSKVKGSKGAGIVKVSEISKSFIIPSSTANSFHADNSIAKIFEDIGKGEATPEEQEIRNREHSAASKKMKNVEYCAEKKVTDLDLVGTWVFAAHGLIVKHLPDVEGAAGLMRVWKQSKSRQLLVSIVNHMVVENTQIEIPRNELIDFANIIHGLSGVFNLSNADNTLFNIFWHPDDRDLMGFNRNRLIFLNLAHYVEKRESNFILPIDSPNMYYPSLGAAFGMAYIEWYVNAKCHWS